MCKVDFRLLEKDEIECRVQSVMKDNSGCILLLYKTARTDYNLLDEVVGAMNWQCEYKEIKGNLYCTISIYNKDTNQWISKSNCGVESNTEAEKGEASDSFKRSGFAWGIGRELYTAPFTYIKLTDADFKNSKLKTTFKVKEIGYTNKSITKLVIEDDKGAERFSFGKQGEIKVEKPKAVKSTPKQQKSENEAKNDVKENNNEESINKLEELRDLICKKCDFLGKDVSKMMEASAKKYGMSFEELPIEILEKLNAQMDKLLNS